MTVKELEALQAKRAHSGSTKSNATHQRNTKELTSGLGVRFIPRLPSEKTTSKEEKDIGEEENLSPEKVNKLRLFYKSLKGRFYNLFRKKE